MNHQSKEGAAWRALFLSFLLIAVGIPKLIIHLEIWQWNLTLCIFSFLSAAVAIIIDTRLNTHYLSGFLKVLAIYTLVFILFEVFYGTSQTGYKVLNTFNLLTVYSFVMFSLPINYMLRKKYISLEEVLLAVSVCTGASLLVRFSLSIVESSTGIALCPDISLESAAKGWIRNGIVRINPPSLSVLVVGICMYWVLYETNHKILFGSLLLLQIIYTNFIHAARSTFLVSVVAIIVLLVFNTRKTKSNYLMISLFGLLLCLAILYEPVFNSFQSFLGSFSATGSSELAGSTVARLNGLEYFSSLYLKTNPYLGFGALGYQEQIALSGGYTFDDLGTFRVVFQFGLPGIVFYLLIYGRVVQACCLARTCNYRHIRELGQLILGCLIVVVMSSVNIDLFYLYAASAPILIAISDFVIFKARNSDSNISIIDRNL